MDKFEVSRKKLIEISRLCVRVAPVLVTDHVTVDQHVIAAIHKHTGRYKTPEDNAKAVTTAVFASVLIALGSHSKEDSDAFIQCLQDVGGLHGIYLPMDARDVQLLGSGSCAMAIQLVTYLYFQTQAHRNFILSIVLRSLCARSATLGKCTGDTALEYLRNDKAMLDEYFRKMDT